MKKTLGLAALALALSACGGGGGGGGGSTSACTVPADGTCFTVSSSSVDNATLQTLLAQECTGQGGTVSGSCPTSGLAGKCTLVVTEGTISVTTVVNLYTAHYTTAEAQSQCAAQGGTFRAP